MKFRLFTVFLGIVLSVPTIFSRQSCQGWRVLEETGEYTIAEHFHSDRCVQTIQMTNHGNVYFLVVGPYGYDQFFLNAMLPRNFPHKYLKKCCWLRRTKNGEKLVMSYVDEEPSNLLVDTMQS